MTPEDYVSYPLALALKKVGFDEPCHYGYSVKMRLEPEISFGEPKMVQSKTPKNYNDNRKGITKGLEFCSAVPLWQAQKWLREKGIHISVNPYMGYDIDADGALYNEYPSWGFELMGVASAEFMNDAGGNHTSYETALSAGIAAALELIENNKNN